LFSTVFGELKIYKLAQVFCTILHKIIILQTQMSAECTVSQRRSLDFSSGVLCRRTRTRWRHLHWGRRAQQTVHFIHLPQQL